MSFDDIRRISPKAFAVAALKSGVSFDLDGEKCLANYELALKIRLIEKKLEMCQPW
jgi:hypothetical protein